MLTKDGVCEVRATNMVEALPTAFAELDEDIRDMGPVERPTLPSRIPSMPSLKLKRPGASSSSKSAAQDQVDMHTRMVTSEEMGSTATLVIITPLQFYFCNCGDSRAILVSDGMITFRTKDHTPEVASERKRVEESGGRVQDNRVDGLLAVTRALGDFHFKADRGSHRHDQKVISKPDVSVIPRNHRTNEYVVLASDGLWGTITDEEVQAIVSARLAQGMSVGLVCDELIRMSIKRGSLDNIAVLILRFEKPESF
jgi:serine/threonine protein phosphatase PrpC